MPDNPQSGVPGVNNFNSPKYRVRLPDADGNVQTPTPIPVADDVTAKVVSKSMASGLAAELWNGLRFIERYEPT